MLFTKMSQHPRESVVSRPQLNINLHTFTPTSSKTHLVNVTLCQCNTQRGERFRYSTLKHKHFAQLSTILYDPGILQTLAVR